MLYMILGYDREPVLIQRILIRWFRSHTGKSSVSEPEPGAATFLVKPEPYFFSMAHQNLLWSTADNNRFRSHETGKHDSLPD